MMRGERSAQFKYSTFEEVLKPLMKTEHDRYAHCYPAMTICRNTGQSFSKINGGFKVGRRKETKVALDL